MVALPRLTPAQLGIDAGGLLAFLDAVEDTGTDLHSLMILRHGAVAAEGWWAPYRRHDIQLLYSLSKTFLAMAVGIAIGGAGCRPTTWSPISCRISCLSRGLIICGSCASGICWRCPAVTARRRCR